MTADQAIIEQLRLMDVAVEDKVGMYRIGVPLVAKGYTQDDILNGLFSLKSRGNIEILDDNQLQLLKPLTG